MAKPHAVVVGGGPAGNLMAIHLAEQRYQVSVYEMRKEPACLSSQRTYTMILTNRAMRCFKEVECMPACMLISSTGYYFNGQVRPIPPDASWLCERTDLTKDLLDEAKRLHGDSINFHFEAPLMDLDLTTRQATFSMPGGKVTEVSYDLLVGADGQNSAVRSFMQQQMGGFRWRVMFDSSFTYKTFSGLPLALPGPDGASVPLLPGIEEHQPRRHMYTFSRQGGPGSLVVCFMDERQKMRGFVGRVPSYDADDVLTRLSKDLPQIPEPYARAMAQQVADDSPPFRPGRTVGCNRFVGPRVALVGDAAHGMTAHTGQGCNAALETVSVLASALRDCNGNIDAALLQYERQRMPEVQALQHLDMCAAVQVDPQGKVPGLLLWAYVRMLYISSELYGALLHKLWPKVHTFPTPYHSMAMRDASIPYSCIQSRLHWVALGLGATAVAGVAVAAALLGGGAWYMLRR